MLLTRIPAILRENILHRYHNALLAHGVEIYSWEDLLRDYQMGLIYWVLMPVQDCAGGSSRDYWWPKMQCLVAAFQEWGCEKLLTARAIGEN